MPSWATVRDVFPRKATRQLVFVLTLVGLYLLPLAVPNVGLDYPYFFIMVITLMAWFVIKWEAFRGLTNKGALWEVATGVILIVGVYAYNLLESSRVGLLDLLVIFSALVLAFFGLRSFRLFWVPATYGIVLLLGYQLENDIPNFVALQDWMAGVLASSMHLFGITAASSGEIISLNSGAATLQLDVQSDCTGIQGILAFGMLSTMALLDTKPKASRLVPVFIVGFVGVFLINILRLIVVVLSFEFLGVAVGTEVHVYAGYTLFIIWVLAFWSLAFRYLSPRGPARPAPLGGSLDMGVGKS